MAVNQSSVESHLDSSAYIVYVYIERYVEFICN